MDNATQYISPPIPRPTLAHANTLRYQILVLPEYREMIMVLIQLHLLRKETLASMVKEAYTDSLTQREPDVILPYPE